MFTDFIYLTNSCTIYYKNQLAPAHIYDSRQLHGTQIGTRQQRGAGKQFPIYYLYRPDLSQIIQYNYFLLFVYYR